VHAQPGLQISGLNASRVHCHSQRQLHRIFYSYVTLAPFDLFACVISPRCPPFEMALTGWESMMVTLRINPPARLGAHLLAQQRIPHAALSPADKGVAVLFSGRVALGLCSPLGQPVACT
jgi:hypothetical protein